MSHQFTPTLFQASKILCPLCREYAELLTIRRAAALAKVCRRTIYHYIQAGDIFAVRVAGKRYRVCSKCLIKPVDAADD